MARRPAGFGVGKTKGKRMRPPKPPAVPTAKKFGKVPKVPAVPKTPAAPKVPMSRGGNAPDGVRTPNVPTGMEQMPEGADDELKKGL